MVHAREQAGYDCVDN